MMHWKLWIRAALVLLVALQATAAERWYTFSLGEHPAGHYSEVETSDGKAVRVQTDLYAKLTRLGKDIEIRFRVISEEDASGALQRLDYESQLSKQTTRLEARVNGDAVVIRTVTAPDAPPHERSIARGDHPLLGPAAIARLTHERLRKEGDEIAYHVFSPELQNVARVRRTLRGFDAAPCGGTSRMRIEETVDGVPITRTLWVDAEAKLVADNVPGPFGTMTNCRSTRETALAADAGATLPADLYERSVVRANVRLADPDAVDRIVLRVTPKDRAQPLPNLAAHNQNVNGELVEIRRPAVPTRRSVDADAEYLAPNALVESTHPDVVKIAAEVTREARDPYEKALALTRWTAENMKMDGGIVMAPASELIRDRKGTCMGFATLLAALARAAGIPSRVALGSVYYGGIWGGHAWAEMHIGGAWLPFDAAVYAPGIAGPARLAVGATSFADGGGTVMNQLGPLFMNANIEIVEYETAGKVARIPADARPYTVTYEGAGLRIAAPGFVVEKADGTWPSTLLVSFRGDGANVELHQQRVHPAGAAAAIAKHVTTKPRETTLGAFRGLLATDKDKAVFATAEGATLWLYSMTGPDAEAKLRRFVSRVQKRAS